MIQFLTAFIWGIFVFFALAGWGFLANKILLRKTTLDLGWLTALGVAVAAATGGFLDYFSAISKTTVIGFLFLGFCFFLVWIFENRHKFLIATEEFFSSLGKRKVLAFLFFVTLLFGGLKYALSVSPGNFNLHDDFQAYFVFPEKMLQTGHLGNDPFSERRIVSMFGSGYFLDTFVSSRLPEKNLHLLDQGILLLALLAIVWGFAKDFNVSMEHRLLLLLVVLLIDQPVFNITSMFAGTLLFLAMARLFYFVGRHKDLPLATRAILPVLFTSGLISLKSNFIPGASILFVCYYYFIYREAKQKAAVITEFILAGLLIVFLLAPWMVSMYKSSGTLFYPILGKGFYGAIPGTIPSPNAEFFSLNGLARAFYSVRQILLFALGLLALFYFKIKSRANFEPALPMLIASIFSFAIILYVTGAIDVYRYVFPILLATFIVLMVSATRPETGQVYFPSINLSYLAVGFISAGLVVGNGLGIFLDQEKAVLAALKFGLSNRQLITSAQKSQYSALQQAVPEGKIILARLDNNYLFNFSRNPVYIVDSPGAVSPPPGMPFFSGGEALAQYFLSKNIDFIAYSYKDQANFNLEYFGLALDPAIHPWVRARTQQIFDFQANLENLGKTRKRIYDDGNNFVLDLKEKVR